jgi:hypothetical protein
MTIPNHSLTPPVWDETQLASHAQRALHEFVDRRLKEPKGRYITHLNARHDALVRLFKILAHIDPANPDPEVVRQILLDADLFSALRYVTGPPVSEDDLGVLVLRKAERLTKKAIRADEAIPIHVLALICQMADPSRFPWVGTGREPLMHELKIAIRATTALHASQTLQTERRGYGKKLEQQLEEHLISLSFEKVQSPPKGRVNAPRHYPQAKKFYGECTVYGRKTDLLIGLEDGRIVAVEAKDSSSVVNSVKRVLNDTAAKARHWRGKAGEQIIPVALLSGVFGLHNLKNAQDDGLYLVWAHDLDSFSDWLATQ